MRLAKGFRSLLCCLVIISMVMMVVGPAWARDRGALRDPLKERAIKGNSAAAIKAPAQPKPSSNLGAKGGIATGLVMVVPYSKDSPQGKRLTERFGHVFNLHVIWGNKTSAQPKPKRTLAADVAPTLATTLATTLGGTSAVTPGVAATALRKRAIANTAATTLGRTLAVTAGTTAIASGGAVTTAVDKAAAQPKPSSAKEIWLKLRMTILRPHALLSFKR